MGAPSGAQAEVSYRSTLSSSGRRRQAGSHSKTTPQKGGRGEEPQSESSVAAEEDGLLMGNEDQWRRLLLPAITTEPTELPTMLVVSGVGEPSYRCPEA